jgi:nucleotide-binding universal stress UspA family protein
MTILFAYDGSESADAAIVAAGKLFDQDQPDAVVLTVWEPLIVEELQAARFGGWTYLPLNVGDLDEESKRQAQALAERGAALAGEAGFAARPLWVADERQIADTIIESADELHVDLIVMGTRGLNGVASFFGGVSNHLVRHSPRPILVVPRHEAHLPDVHDKELAAASKTSVSGGADRASSR